MELLYDWSQRSVVNTTMKTLLLILASISLSGCFATVGVAVPVQPVYVRPAPVVVYPAPVIVYPRDHDFSRYGGMGHYSHHY